MSVSPAHPGPTPGNESREWGSFLPAVTPPVQLVLLLVGRKSRGKSHTLLLSCVPRAFPPGGSNHLLLALLSSCRWAQGTQQVEHAGARPHSLAALRLRSPAAGLTIPLTVALPEHYQQMG